MNGPTNLDISDLVDIQEEINQAIIFATPFGSPIFSIDLNIAEPVLVGDPPYQEMAIGGLFSILNRIDLIENKAIDIKNSISRSVKDNLIEYHNQNGGIPNIIVVHHGGQPILESIPELYDDDPAISDAAALSWTVFISILFMRKYARKNNIINYEE